MKQATVKLAFLVLILPLLSFGRLNLIATTYPIYYPLKFLAGDLHQVNVLINTPADPHHHELKPNDLLKLKRADYVFLLGLENWEKQIEKRIGKDKLVPLYKDINLIKLKGVPDPHVWVSPKSYMVLVTNIYNKLVSIDQQNKNFYKDRFDKYIKALEELDKQYQETLSKCTVKVIAATHLSTSYLARDYGLEAAGIRGMHAEEEPRPSEVKRFINILKGKHVKAIFVEPGQDKTVAEKIAKELNAQVLLLNTSLFPEKADDEYISIMKRNLESLKKGLQCH